MILAFDVSNSMRADGSRADPDRCRQGGGPHLRGARSPSSIEIGVVAFSDGGLVTQQPTSVRRARCWPPSTGSRPLGATSLGQGIFTALNAIAGKPITVDPARARRPTSTTSTSATSARPRSCCCPTARTRRTPTRWPWPSWRRWRACRSTRSGSGSTEGTVRGDRRLQRGDGARRGAARRRSPRSPDGTYFQAEDADVAGARSTTASTCSSTVRGRARPR